MLRALFETAMSTDPELVAIGEQMGVVGVLERIVAAWLEPEVVDGCPWSPRVVGDVDHEVLAPVPVDLGGRQPTARP